MGPVAVKASPMPRAGRIRIIGGTLRGSRIDVPHSPGLRPTPDRVRETLFNWLQPVIAGARCLDLFAGSGANALEAVSRGAAQAVLVERDPALAERLRGNIQRLHVENATVIRDDALRWLRESGPGDSRFDIVFMDPPFALDVGSVAARLLEEGGWLAPAAMVYVELPAERSITPPDAWRIHRQGRAGALGYTLYQRISQPANP